MWRTLWTSRCPARRLLQALRVYSIDPANVQGLLQVRPELPGVDAIHGTLK